MRFLPTSKHWGKKNPAHEMQCANGTFDEAVDIFSLTSQSRLHNKKRRNVVI